MDYNDGYSLRRIGSKSLRENCIRVTDYSSLDKLLSAMRFEMSAHNGAGIAAPQVGDNRRVIMIVNGFAQEMVNPEILDSERRIVTLEGCLSLPIIRLPKIRSHYIKVGYEDRHGNHFEQWIEGIKAVAVQHEIDHLDGRLISDYAIF